MFCPGNRLMRRCPCLAGELKLDAQKEAAIMSKLKSQRDGDVHRRDLLRQATTLMAGGGGGGGRGGPATQGAAWLGGLVPGFKGAEGPNQPGRLHDGSRGPGPA